MDYIEEVLKILRRHNVSINFEKSTFCATEVKYLGQIISKNGIKPDLTIISQLSKWKSPNNLRELRRLLGLINWFRPYLPNLSQAYKKLTIN